MISTNIPTYIQYWAVDMYNTEGATMAIQFCDLSEMIVAVFLLYTALCK